MRKFFHIIILSCFILSLLSSCEKDINTQSPHIEGLSIDNYPIVDGSTSTLPLNKVIACELMGLDYKWEEKQNDKTSKSWSIEQQIGGSLKRKFNRVIRSSQTHNAYVNLINGDADLIFTARTMSPDEKKYSQNQGVTLIETPIALDAFIFIVNPENPLESLTIEQIQSIYTGKVNDWGKLGWYLSTPSEASSSFQIEPFVRNPNSGSQELMDELVMRDLEYFSGLPVYEEHLIFTMVGMLDAVASNPSAIGYTVYYYNEKIIRPGNWLKTIAINGVHPNKNSISDRSYPYTTEVYAVIRSDIDKSSMTYKIYEWLQTESGKQAISKSGYLRING